MRRPTVYSLRRLVPLALTLCVLLGAALLCTACSRGTPLSAPTGTRLDEITLTLSWNKVKGAAYYTVRIRPDDGSDADLAAVCTISVTELQKAALAAFAEE